MCVTSYQCASLATRTVCRAYAKHCSGTATGWINTFHEDELVELFLSAGWRCVERRTLVDPRWRRSASYVFVRP